MTYLKECTNTEIIHVLDALSRTCRKLGGPLTNQMYNLFRDGLYRELIDFKIDYSWHFSNDDFIYARQIQAFLQKQDFLDLGVDKEEVAFQSFIQSEDICRETNRRLKVNEPRNWDVGGILYTAQRKISRILGRCPEISELQLSFGPGATTSTKSAIACPRTKLSANLECSTNLLPLVGSLLLEVPHLCAVNSDIDSDVWNVPVTQACGKLAFVPKDCTKHRAIVVEPNLNGLIQKGIGTWMKARLLRAGLDLTDQTKNQSLARKGSIDGTLCTIDLSSASDSISRELVWQLLPYDWAVLLDCSRSETVSYKGSSYLLEKFSSMGNAFTFELESLIFYALTASTCEQIGIDRPVVSVYGDDIICPSSAYPLLSEVLEYCGFSINKKKSFYTGLFRESCGADYLAGIDIRPFYLKSRISERVLYTMHNWFIRHAEPELAKQVYKFTNPVMRISGPDGYGDGHLIGDLNIRQSRKQKRDGWCGWTFDTYVLTPRSYIRVLKGDYVYPLYSIYISGDPDRVPSDPNVVRGHVGYVKKSIYTLVTTIFSGGT